MKTAFVKKSNNLRIPFFNRNITFGEIDSKREFYLLDRELTEDIVFLGIVIGLGCDFLLLEDSTEVLPEYDMIVSLDVILNKKYRQDQLLCYIEPEPFGWSSGNTGIFSNRQSVCVPSVQLADLHNPKLVPPYDYLLNNYVGYTKYPHSVPYWCRFLIKETQSVAQPKNPDKVYVNIRTMKFHIEPSGKGLSPEFRYEFDLGMEERKGITYRSFYSRLSSCKFCLNLDDSISAGQLAAECSILGVITLGKRQKLFNKLLLPEYCFIESAEEGYKKIREINGSNDLYEELLALTSHNLYKIDHTKSLEHLNRYIPLK
jgi:hypothetical protein